MFELIYHHEGMHYSDEIILVMRKFYHSLSEKDRRRYAAVEARKLGHGGISYISRVLGCSRDTVKSGMNQLEQLSIVDLSSNNIRRQGAGRKRTIETMLGLEEAFRAIIQRYNPKSAKKVVLTQQKVSELLEAEGFKVSVTVIKQLIQEYETGESEKGLV